VFDLPQDVLQQLLTTLNTNPGRLSDSEKQIASRICLCSDCRGFWVRRKAKVPDRCPQCSSRKWDRPFLNALLAAQPTTTNPHPPATEKTNGGEKP
jgi:predicted Zn-ribbon and HTH transcriptional regulator